jgi:hypothetical protein
MRTVNVAAAAWLAVILSPFVGAPGEAQSRGGTKTTQPVEPRTLNRVQVTPDAAANPIKSAGLQTASKRGRS